MNHAIAAQATIQPALADAVNLVQITDTHIYAHAAGSFKGIDTWVMLERVIGTIRNLTRPPDLVLVTGDLVHDPEPKAYRRLRQQLQELQLPVFCLPGNHDAPEIMHGELNTGLISTTPVIRCGDWRILLLDTFLPEQHGGHLHAAQLDFLRRQLEQSNKAHVLIALHHHPVLINSAWMDNMMLDNAAAFWTIIEQYPQVRAVIWGHIHQPFAGRRGGIELLGTPSTCIQFKPLTEDPVMDDRPPALRRLSLTRDGTVRNELCWMETNQS